MPKLGVNIDHVATLRQARCGIEPEPVWAASLCELAGCDSIVIHLREDRRHINDRDLYLLRETINTRLNLEMSVDSEIVSIARRIVPDQATLVPERRKEITTEGGLDVLKNKRRIKEVIKILSKKKVDISLFIDPEANQIEAAKLVGAGIIELHTGSFAVAKNRLIQKRELKKLKEAVIFAKNLSLIVNAGHGLNYKNVTLVSCIEGIEELNIGHSIISRAVFVGLFQAVREMLELVRGIG